MSRPQRRNAIRNKARARRAGDAPPPAVAAPRAAAQPDPWAASEQAGEALCREILRRIRTVRGMPRRCHAAVCRRSGRCDDPAIRCVRDFPGEPVSKEKGQARLAAVRRWLARRIAEHEAAELQAASPEAASPEAGPPPRRHGASSAAGRGMR